MRRKPSHRPSVAELDNRSRRGISLLIAALLICAFGIGGTVAYLTAEADPVVNEFQAGSVSVEVDEESFDGSVKTGVSVENTGSVEAYIRAAVVVNWADEDGKVYGKAPVAGEDYEIVFADDDADGLPGKWVEVDGLHYWTMPVEPNGGTGACCSTGMLIVECKPVEGKAPEGYFLNVEIMGSGVQAYGATGSGRKAVEEAWSSDRVTVEVKDDRSLAVTLEPAVSGGQGGGGNE